MSDTCYHCGSLLIIWGTCNCCICGLATAGGQWIAGSCVACKGRRDWDELRPLLDAKGIDPREKKYWVRVSNPRDQSPSHAVFVPERDWRAGKK